MPVTICIPPHIKNLYRPPARYDVEVFNENTGFWDRLSNVPVIWPTRWVYKRTWYLVLVPREVLDVGNKVAIMQARYKAHESANRGFSRTRILEVKDTSYRYVIWEDGVWIQEFDES